MHCPTAARRTQFATLFLETRKRLYENGFVGLWIGVDLFCSIQRNSKNLNVVASQPSADPLTLFIFDSPISRDKSENVLPALRCRILLIR